MFSIFFYAQKSSDFLFLLKNFNVPLIFVNFLKLPMNLLSSTPNTPNIHRARLTPVNVETHKISSESTAIMIISRLVHTHSAAYTRFGNLWFIWVAILINYVVSSLNVLEITRHLKTMLKIKLILDVYQVRNIHTAKKS